MIAAFGPVGHVANLGHGILPDVRAAHARAFIDAVKEWRWTEEALAAASAVRRARPTRGGLMSAAVFPSSVRSRHVSTESRRAEATRWIAGLHDELTSFFGRLDGGGTFIEDRWERPGGGGGVARVMTDGVTFEKAGINRSAVMGELPELAARRLGGRGAAAGATQFFATGVSLVVHPRSPKVPTVHLNVRYFELTDEARAAHRRWFGGGTDLTPFYPHDDDAPHFHARCARSATGTTTRFYADFKRWCDEYFVNTHRDNEARGIGGIFFDHLRPDDRRTA